MRDFSIHGVTHAKTMHVMEMNAKKLYKYAFFLHIQSSAESLLIFFPV